ncbi:MAG TPA: hypothetical protein PLB41_05355 [Rubrivivax sp.]|nr:hypothetical protein [Rubrivivax sp.]HPP82933.1 hypothetical protein [Rubrivivax sp.]
MSRLDSTARARHRPQVDPIRKLRAMPPQLSVRVVPDSVYDPQDGDADAGDIILDDTDATEADGVPHMEPWVLVRDQ